MAATLIVGLALGLFVGAPGAIERYALGTLSRLETRFGVRLSAESVEWTWGGQVVATNVTLSSGPHTLVTVPRAELDLDVSVLDRSARLVSLTLQGPRLELVRHPDGSTNFDKVLAALKNRGGGATTPSKLDLSTARIEITDLDVALTPSLTSNDLEIPARIELRHGRVKLEREEKATRIALQFDDTTLDPGQPFSVELGFGEEGSLSPRLGPLGHLERVAVSPARPVRFWFGERVVGLGGIALSREGLELFPLQLSVPVAGRTPTGEVSAAATVGRVVIGVPEVARLMEPGAVGRLSAQLASAMSGKAVSPLSRLHLASPVLSLAIAGSRHSFDDLVGLMGREARSTDSAATGVSAHISPGPGNDDKLLVSANRAAIDRVLATPGKKSSDGRVSNAPMARSVAQLVGHLSSMIASGHDRLDRLRERLTRVQHLAGELVVENGELTLDIDGLPLDLTGVTLSLVSAKGDTHTDLVLHIAADSPFVRDTKVETTLRMPEKDGPTAPIMFSLKLPTLPMAELSDLPGKFHFLPRGSISLDLNGQLTSTSLEMTFDVALEGVAFAHTAIAADPLTGIDTRVSGRLRLDTLTQRLSLSELVFRSGEVEITGALDIDSATTAPRIKLDLLLPETPLPHIIAALPEGFAPMLTGLRMEGALGWKLTVDLDTTQPGKVQFDSEPRPRGIRVLSLGERLDFAALRTSHAYTIRLFDGTPGSRVVGPATASWIPLGNITPHLPLALTTTEDGTFYSNDGISTFAMKESIATNLERGTFARGASTITQQLVKNLFLGGGKTVSRKLQEVFISWQLAQFLSKDEIMALYLNTIEFGPGLYGVGDAAWHWFGKRPIDLTLAEAVFLASIVPGPRRYYTFFEQGGITPRWASYIEALLKVMVQRKKITAEELATSLPVQVHFRGHGGGYTDEVPADFDLVPDRDDLDPEAEPPDDNPDEE